MRVMKEESRRNLELLREEMKQNAVEIKNSIMEELLPSFWDYE